MVRRGPEHEHPGQRRGQHLHGAIVAPRGPSRRAELRGWPQVRWTVVPRFYNFDRAAV
jgi:hypothetical protein